MTPTPTTRASLLFRLRDSQDHEAWLEFVEIYEPVIYRQLRKCGLQDADARELMQEFFIAVSRRIEHWELAKERGSFRGWLRRVTRNLVINWMKHGQRRMMAFGGPESQSLFAEIAADDCPESIEFDSELRRSTFQRASESVRQEQSLKTWQAFAFGSQFTTLQTVPMERWKPARWHFESTKPLKGRTLRIEVQFRG